MGRSVFVLAWLLAVAAWMARHHVETVDVPFAEVKAGLHEQVLANEAPDPYQYKLWAITQALEGVRRATDAPLLVVLGWNTVLSTLALVLCHHLWLRSLVGRREALVGALVLAALANTAFRGYQHHPYDLWGLALACLLLRGVERSWPLPALAGVGLATGLVWEKHALVPVADGLLGLGRRPFLAVLLRGAVFLAATVAVPVAIRLWVDRDLSAPRPSVDGAGVENPARFDLVLQNQVPFVLPFLLTLLVTWRRQPRLVRALWVALPLLVLGYAAKRFILYEVRSFLFLIPVFTATVAVALRVSARGPARDPGIVAPRCGPP